MTAGVVGSGYQAELTFNGETRTLTEWARKVGIHEHTIYTRIFCRGHSVEKALTKKPLYERHGNSDRPEWYLWQAMKRRCNKPGTRGYERYGGRGIKVCKEWEDSFQAFFDDMGPRPSPKHSLERLKNEEGYYPGNVVWATAEEQSRNTRRNVHLEYRGQKKVLKDWAREFGLSNTTLWNRLFTLGWDLDRALTTPPGRNGRKKVGE